MEDKEIIQHLESILITCDLTEEQENALIIHINKSKAGPIDKDLATAIVLLIIEILKIGGDHLNL